MSASEDRVTCPHDLAQPRSAVRHRERAGVQPRACVEHEEFCELEGPAQPAGVPVPFERGCHEPFLGGDSMEGLPGVGRPKFHPRSPIVHWVDLPPSTFPLVPSSGRDELWFRIGQARLPAELVNLRRTPPAPVLELPEPSKGNLFCSGDPREIGRHGVAQEGIAQPAVRQRGPHATSIRHRGTRPCAQTHCTVKLSA